MKERQWFDGKRLSTYEQDQLVRRVLKDPKCQSISTGDTLVNIEFGAIVVWRQDFSHNLTEEEFNAREAEES